MEDRFSILLFRTSLVGCLLGIAATTYLFLGWAGHLDSPLLNLLVGASVIGASVFFLKAFFEALRETNWIGRIIGLFIFLILGVEVILCLMPPTARDELTHHLAIPRLYVRAGRIIEVPMAPYSYYPMLLDMLYTPWLYWGHDWIPKLVHGLFAFLTGLLLYAYLSRRMSALYGLLGFFFFISLPSVLRLSHWAYVDLGITFYITASLLCVLRWLEEKSSTGWLMLAALSAGFSLATKPNGLIAWLLLFFLLALALAGATERGFTHIVSDLLIFVVVGALPFLPWLAKNWFQTGNPFFPLLGSFFSANGGGAGGDLTHVSLGVLTKRELLYGENWWQIAALPLRVFLFGKDDDPQYFDGVLSPILLLLLPWTFQGKWPREKQLLLSFAFLFFAYALFLADLRIRYILPMVPPLVALLVYGVFNVYLRIRRPAYLFAGLLFFAGLNASYLWSYWLEEKPIGYLFGRETREDYLARRLPEFSAYRYVNRELPPTAKIYLLFVGRRAYYCERAYFHDGGELPAFLFAAVQAVKEPADIGRHLKAKELTHLLVRDDLLVSFLRDNLDPAQQRVWNSFASDHLKTLFRDRGYSVLQLHG